MFVPSAEYMLALKLAALRVDPKRGAKDRDDIKNLLAIVDIRTPEAAADFTAAFLPEYERTSPLYPRFLAQFTDFFDEGIAPSGTPRYEPAAAHDPKPE